MNNKIEVGAINATYIQDSDGNDRGDLRQAIDVTCEEDRGRKYFVIKTERWAFDKVEDLTDILKDFAKRIKA
jgi:hypothetical protein